jgi:nitrogen fixation/metabolism regulation signal transduction histidine kinase
VKSRSSSPRSCQCARARARLSSAATIRNWRGWTVRIRPRAVRPDGAGLGLALVKSIVDLHGGAATIESNPRGTIVKLRFPLSRT